MSAVPAKHQVDLKIVTLGHYAVGKTSLVQRYLNETFDENVAATVGAAFGAKKVGNLTLGIWDTAGSERYQSLARIYYRGAKAAIVCYDVSCEESFELVSFWCDELEANEDNAKVYIVATKTDLPEVQVPTEKAKALAHERGAKFFLTSARTGENVNLLFDTIAEDYIASQAEKGEGVNGSGDVVAVTTDNPKGNGNPRCCER